MIFPLLSEYVDAVMSPSESLDKLNYLHPVLDDTGRPVMSSGNFAVVFKMEDSSKKQYALKCFLRDQEGREQSYKLISDQLDLIQSPFFLKVKYLEKEIFVDTSTSTETEFPVLIMDWVEGKTLDRYIREQRTSTFRLRYLAYSFSVLANWLHEMPFAHGDLKPDNIIVKDDGQIVLVDYDGMFIHPMLGQEAREIGSPDFRHPARTSKQFDEHIDDFPLVSILLSLKLISLKPELIDNYGAQDRLLFSASDYQNPDSCPLFKDQEFYDYESRNLLWALLDNLKNCDKFDSIEVLKNPIMDSSYEIVSEDDLETSWKDPYGVLYSNDRLRLLKAPEHLNEYDVIKGTLCICSKAFSDCRILKAVRFPNTVSRIGYQAFSDCHSLEQVSLPIHLKTIESGTFFRCSGLSKVYISSEELKEIAQEAFMNCSCLKEIDIPDSVRLIARKAFLGCENLYSIRLPSSLKDISYSVFEGCKSLTSVNLPQVQAIYSRAFAGCTSLQSIFLPDSVAFINEEAFQGCSSLSTIRFPRNINRINTSAFWGCTSLSTAYGESIPVGSPYIVVDGNLFITNKYITSFEVPENVTEIPAEAFSCCKELKSILLHDRITTIGIKAFSHCESLEKIIIPASVNQIQDLAFEGCKSLRSISFLGELYCLATGTFYGCESLTGIHLPKGLEDLGLPSVEMLNHDYPFKGTFSGCKSLCTISIPNSVTVIPRDTFSDCISLRSIELNDRITIIGDNAFSNCKSIESLVLPASVNSIGGQAFSGCISLKSVRILGHVKDLDGGTFSGCESLTDIQLPEGLETIGELHLEDEYGQYYDYQITGDFLGCKSLRKISIPSSVTLLGAGTFQGCKSLEEVHLPTGLKYVGDYAFCLCESLKNITIPMGVLSIGSYCFYECSSLSKVTISSRTITLGYRPFENCYSLDSFESELSSDNKSIIINGVLEAFAPKDVSEYRIPEGVIRINRYVFYNCEKLEHVYLPESIREIGYAAFADCANLSTINIPGSIKEIGDSAFEGCPCENSLVFPNGIDYQSDPHRWLDEAHEHQYRI